MALFHLRVLAKPCWFGSMHNRKALKLIVQNINVIKSSSWNFWTIVAQRSSFLTNGPCFVFCHAHHKMQQLKSKSREEEDCKLLNLDVYNAGYKLLVLYEENTFVGPQDKHNVVWVKINVNITFVHFFYTCASSAVKCHKAYT